MAAAPHATCNIPLLQQLETLRDVLQRGGESDPSELSSCLLEVVSAATGRRDEASEKHGAGAVLSLLRGNIGDHYQPLVELFDQLQCPPAEVISTVVEALERQASTEAENDKNLLGNIFSIAPAENDYVPTARGHNRTLIKPDDFAAVLDVLFAIQLSNPFDKSVEFLCKDYLEAEVLLDLPPSGDVSLWWGPSMCDDIAWVCAVWTSSLRASRTVYSTSSNFGTSSFAGDSCLSMQLIGRVVNLLMNSNFTLLWQISALPIFGNNLNFESLSLSNIVMNSKLSGSSTCVDVHAIKNGIHVIHQSFIRMLSRSTDVSCEPSTQYPAIHLFILYLHCCQIIDVMMYFILTPILSKDPQSGGSKRKRNDLEARGEQNEFDECREVVEIIMFVNCKENCFQQKNDGSISRRISDENSCNLDRVLFETLLPPTPTYGSLKSYCKQSFNKILQQLKRIAQSEATEAVENIECHCQLLLQILLRISVLDIFSCNTQNESPELFQELCEFFTNCPTSSFPSLNKLKVHLASLLISYIIREIELLENFPSFQTLLVYLMGEGLENCSPCQELKSFFRGQINESSSAFNVMLSSLRKHNVNIALDDLKNIMM